MELAAATAARGIVGAVMGPPSAAIDADTLLQLECVLLSYHKAFRQVPLAVHLQGLCSGVRQSLLRAGLQRGNRRGHTAAAGVRAAELPQGLQVSSPAVCEGPSQVLG